MQSDLMLVVGSLNSSSFNRLKEVAQKQGYNATLLIQQNRSMLSDWKIAINVGVTIGVSASVSNNC